MYTTAKRPKQSQPLLVSAQVALVQQTVKRSADNAWLCWVQAPKQ